MKYPVVLALGATSALAQNYTQTAYQSCVGVVTETVYTYVTTCPCSTASSTTFDCAQASYPGESGCGAAPTYLSTSSTTFDCAQASYPGESGCGAAPTYLSTSTTSTTGSSTNANGGIINSGSASTGTATTTTSVATSTEYVGGSGTSDGPIVQTSPAAGSTTTAGVVGSGSTTIAPPPSPSASTSLSANPVPTSATTTTTTFNGAVPSPAVPAPGTTQRISLRTLGSGTSGAGLTPSDYIYKILYAHNLHRNNASIPILTWDPTRAQYAAQLAATCVYGHSNAQGDGQYGQNIGAGFLPDQVAAMITNAMYDSEINNYPGPYGSDNLNGGFSDASFAGWGHYSQLVWKSTTMVGCATQYCPNGLANTSPGTPPYFTVCNYYPPGNYIGQWSQVATPGGGGTVVFDP